MLSSFKSEIFCVRSFYDKEQRNTTSVLTIFVSYKLDSIIAFVIVVKTYGSCFWFLGIENKTTSAKFLVDFLGKWPWQSDARANFSFFSTSCHSKIYEWKTAWRLFKFSKKERPRRNEPHEEFYHNGKSIVFLIRYCVYSPFGLFSFSIQNSKLWRLIEFLFLKTNDGWLLTSLYAIPTPHPHLTLSMQYLGLFT